VAFKNDTDLKFVAASPEAEQEAYVCFGFDASGLGGVALLASGRLERQQADLKRSPTDASRST
jgi:hypothetical protein